LKKFLWITLSIYILSCLLSLAMVIIGRVQPEQELLDGLESCSNLLCYQGIDLLETPYSEGRSIIESLPGARWSPQDIRRADLPGGAVQWVIIFRSTSDLVREIDMRPRQGTVNVGKLITHLGVPCAVYPFRPFRASLNALPIVILAYPTVVIRVQMQDWRLTPHLPVTEIDLVPLLASEVAVKPCNNINQNVRYEWQGFRQYLYK
jgi:hypothetical protein